jgi:hypothetical protein
MHAYFGGIETMYVSNRKVPHDLRLTSAGDFMTHKTIVLLDELLTHRLALRDLYKSARCQTADIHLRHLHPLFDAHCKEQLALVDVLVDRIGALGGASCVFAGAFLRGTPALLRTARSFSPPPIVVRFARRARNCTERGPHGRHI